MKQASFIRGASAVAAGLALTVGFIPAAGANGGYGHDHGGDGVDKSPTIVADNLNNPRQIAVKGGAVYVAEAGTGGDTCFPDPTDPKAPPVCAGFTGSVTRVGRHGHVDQVQTGLISILAGEGEVVGVDALTFKDGRLYGIATGTCDVPKGAPKEFTDQLGHVLKLKGGTDVSPVADVSAFECENDPDGLGVDTDPYGIVASGKGFYVADAAGNDVLKVNRKGEVSLATVVKPGQTVPTSLAIGPDGALYIGTLNFEAGPGGAAVYRLERGSDEATIYADGLSAITGIAFGKHGTLYVSEFTKSFGDMGPNPDGDVVAIPWGGGTDGRKVIGAGSLHFPGGVGVTDDGSLYVSNWSIATGEDGPFGPGNHGQLVKFATTHGHDDSNDSNNDNSNQ
jgi:hypothetical protein